MKRLFIITLTAIGIVSLLLKELIIYQVFMPDWSRNEYKILRLLVQQKGKVFSNSQIYENIWHMQAIGADNTIAVHIRHIREKIEKNPKDPRYRKVVWGNGYKVG